MKPSRLLLPVVTVLAQAIALADGGTVQFREEAGDLVITVFTSPAPLSVGPVDLSLLLQNQKGLDPVVDANVSLLLRRDATEFESHPTREQARNKLLYAAPVMFSKPGKWLIAVTVERNHQEISAVGSVEVTPAPAKATSYSSYIAFPPVMIALFIIRECLIRRRSKR